MKACNRMKGMAVSGEFRPSACERRAGGERGEREEEETGMKEPLP